MCGSPRTRSSAPSVPCFRHSVLFKPPFAKQQDAERADTSGQKNRVRRLGGTPCADSARENRQAV
ncbi:hypothetical protein [Kingella potus]|uniref:hypothetical protein n=1 Tax=Kingella potus TaxID=265175 RepID=UPI001FD43435|nr:hypothetical protein [Kingella potus]UOP01183.1 hypothetical protein LVJ84_02415 [Kingella potus]